MSIKPNDFLETAKKLDSYDGKTEADRRSSASRAYYAAIHASHHCLPLDLSPDASQLRAKGSHQAIIDAIDAWAKAPRTGRMEAQKLARILRRMREIRKTADYQLDIDFLITESQFALKDAATVLDEVAHATRKLANEANLHN